MALALAFVVAAGAPAGAQDKKAEQKKAADAKKAEEAKKPQASAEWTAYVAYINGIAAATKLEDIFQFLSANQLEMYKTVKSNERLKTLQDLKDAMTARGAFSGTMHLVREENEPKAMYLVIESTTPSNIKIQGRVTMVKEMGWVKVGSAPADEEWKKVN